MCTRASSASSSSLLLLLYSTTRNTRMNHSNCEAFVFSYSSSSRRRCRLFHRRFHRRFHHHHRLFVEPTDALYLCLLCSLSPCATTDLLQPIITATTPSMPPVPLSSSSFSSIQPSIYLAVCLLPAASLSTQLFGAHSRLDICRTFSRLLRLRSSRGQAGSARI